MRNQEARMSQSAQHNSCNYWRHKHVQFLSYCCHSHSIILLPDKAAWLRAPTM